MVLRNTVPRGTESARFVMHSLHQYQMVETEQENVNFPRLSNFETARLFQASFGFCYRVKRQRLSFG